jgi:hypothetical protein
MPSFPSYPSVSPALHVQLETQVDFLQQLTHHAVEALGQLGELNVKTARQLADDAVRLGHALVACTDPYQMSAVAMREAQPAFEHWRDWQTGLMGVLASGNASLARDASDIGQQAVRRGAEAMDKAASQPA